MAARNASASTAKPSRPRRSRRLMVIILGAVSIWAAAAFLDQSGAIREKKEELRMLEQRLSDVRAENAAYRLEVERLQDPEYIEQKVRKDFGMVRPGDKVFDTRQP